MDVYVWFRMNDDRLLKPSDEMRTREHKGLSRTPSHPAHLYRISNLAKESPDNLPVPYTSKRRRSKSETLHETNDDPTNNSIDAVSKLHLSQPFTSCTPDTHTTHTAVNFENVNQATTSQTSKMSDSVRDGSNTSTNSDIQGFRKTPCRIMNWLMFSPINSKYNSSLEGDESKRYSHRKDAFREFNALTPSHW